MAAPKLSDVVCRAFSVALLLSGDMEIAEEVVHDAIGCLDSEAVSSNALVMCVTRLSLPRCSNKSAQAGVPAELQNLLKLPRMPRQCFVLRILLGLPEIRCAELLQVDTREISDAVGLAASRLAQIENHSALHCASKASEFHKYQPVFRQIIGIIDPKVALPTRR